MKILLSAFNCNPDKGSEYGRGWAWVTGLAEMGHEIWVITEADNQSNIERFLSTHLLPNCHFIYCPLAPSANAWWKFKGKQIGLLTQRFELEWRLLLWQWEAYQRAKNLAEQVEFDYVHHVTNTCIRRPSFMGLLEVPFIIGPLAGGARAPWRLRKSYPLVGWLIEFGRDLSNNFVRFNPLMRLTFNRAAKIYCDSEETLALLPEVSRSRAQVLFSIASPKIADLYPATEIVSIDRDIFKVLFAGRFLFWKGVHLGLAAFAQFHEKVPNSRFTIIGQGSEEKRLRKQAEQLGIQDAVEWIGWMNQQELSLAYQQQDVLLFPSLHDTSPNVVLEAFCFGLPVICLDLGGCKVMVDNTCGRVITTANLTETGVVQALSEALVMLEEKPEVLRHLREGAVARKNQFVWRHTIEQVYSWSEISSPDLSTN